MTQPHRELNFFHKLKITYIKFLRETIYLHIKIIHLGNDNMNFSMLRSDNINAKV